MAARTDIRNRLLVPKLCLEKQARTTGNTKTSVPTHARHANAEIPASAGMTRGAGITGGRGMTGGRSVSAINNNNLTPPVIARSEATWQSGLAQSVAQLQRRLHPLSFPTRLGIPLTVSRQSLARNGLIGGIGHSVNRIVLASCMFLSGLVVACDFPVFQWAMENWAADSYEVLVYHDGPLSGEEEALVKLLEEQCQSLSVNAKVTLSNVQGDDDFIAPGVWEMQSGAEAPWMVLRYPAAQSNDPYVWAAPLNETNVHILLDSPVRQKIAAALAEKKTAVWVLLESGDAAADEKAALAIEEALKVTRKTVEIIPLDGDTNEAAEPVTWELSYSLVRVNRDDLKEKAFVQMLLHSESDLADTNLPMAFPMFGRGRALYALVGGGINTTMIEEANVYISDRCGCEVKDQNPGVDMLMGMDWDAVVGTLERAPLAPPSPTALAHVVVDTGVAEEAKPVESAPVVNNVLVVIAIVVLVVLLTSMLVLLRGKEAA